MGQIGSGGNGGDGGIGVFFNASAAIFTNSGTVFGGSGAVGGGDGSGTIFAAAGAGGAGIVGANLSITNSGSIIGGMGGDSITRANAITFTGGTNVLTLLAGSNIVGNVVVAGGTGTLALGGSVNSTIDVSLFGLQYQGFGGFQKTGGSTWTLTGSTVSATPWTISGGTLSISSDSNLGASGVDVTLAGGTLQTTGSFTSARSITLGSGANTLDTTGGTTLMWNGTIGGTGGLTKIGSGTLLVSGVSSYTGSTNINAGRLQVAGGNNILAPASAFSLAPGASLDLGGTAQTVGSLAGGGIVTSTGTGAATLITGGNNASTTFDGFLQNGGNGGSLALVKTGTGTLNLIGLNSYSGGTTVSGGILQGDSASLQGNILNNAQVVFHQGGSGTYAGSMSGTGSLVVRGGGSLAMNGASTYTGPTTVHGATLVVNGSLSSSVTLHGGSMLGGSGSIGGLTANAATLSPGNSIGTMTVTGALTQNGGTYQLEVNSQGQTDRINVGGALTLNGGAVQVQAASGSYANSTTYTILNAAGGVTGTYSGLTENLAFLTPTLSYDANNVYLTLALQGAPFSGGGNTSNQQASGRALDQSYANASGDFATVISALAGLNTTQGPAVLDAISGQPYANVGTTNIANASLFMNTLGQQMAMARGPAGSGQRQALAQACEVEFCDTFRPLSAWISGLGGLGSVQGDGNSSTLTYNFGGTAAGIDYRLDPRFLVGVGVGYSHGTQWVNSFMGQGWTDSISVAAYGSFTQSGFYADALAGYAYFNNQMQRQIQIPGLQQRTASGSTGANQLLAQVESGYKVGLWEQAAMTVTPFARLQLSTTTQNAFTESGAGSLNLTVAQQTTNSLRTVFGAELASSIGLGNQRQLDLALRLGWQHEFADTARPVTASFAGAPTASFTVYGATPTRDAAIIGLSAGTTIAEATQLYLRYDGMLASGSDNHALTAGLRFSW
jgi:autotransporter-associated beta strand protein